MLVASRDHLASILKERQQRDTSTRYMGLLTLVKSTHREDGITVQGDPLNTIDFLPSNGPEASVARDIVRAQLDLDVVKVWFVGRPGLDRVHLESNGRACLASVLGNNIASIATASVTPMTSMTPLATIIAVASVAWRSTVATISRVRSLLDCDLDIGAGVGGARHGHIDLAAGISVDIESGDVVRWGRLDPNALPDATAWTVKDVRRIQGLLSNWDDIWIAVCWIVNEDQPADGQLMVFPTSFVWTHSSF